MMNIWPNWVALMTDAPSYLANADGAPVVLASQSRVRAQLLEGAAIPFATMPAHIDEYMVKQSLAAENAPPKHVAETLAELKAIKVSNAVLSRGATGTFVIGADQVLECNGVLFDKPVDMDHAHAHLKALSGKLHRLWSAVVIAKDGTPIWRKIAHASLTMRPLSDQMISHYLEVAGDVVLTSCGAYQVEGPGIQLFAHIEGDQSTIQGLPLLPLLDFLRVNNVLPD